MRVGRHPAQDNPFWHMRAYSLQNPMVCEALARGAYDEISCQHCRRGKTRDGYQCFYCHGSGFRPSRPVCRQDFGDEESLAIAQALDPSIGRSREFYWGQLR